MMPIANLKKYVYNKYLFLEIYYTTISAGTTFLSKGRRRTVDKKEMSSNKLPLSAAAAAPSLGASVTCRILGGLKS